MLKIAISLRFTDIINYDMYCKHLVEIQNYNLRKTGSDKHHTPLMHLVYYQFFQESQFYHNISFLYFI